MTQAPVHHALALAAAGRPADAVAALTAAADRGNVDALMQFAVWHLIGEIVPRDFAAVRSLLRRAVEIGHVDGALMEIALTANGTGAPADWSLAVSRLAAAAKADPVAAAQHDLLRAMRFRDDGTPVALPDAEPLSVSPSIVRYPALLSPAECAHLAAVAAELLEPASVLDPRTGARIAHPIRTSDGMAIGPTREDLVVRAINRRIATASGTAIDCGEPLTILRYRPGQQYRPHLDTIAGAANQRVATVLVYLNEGFGGGETVFPDAGVTITPRGGDAVVFTNILADGRPDLRTRHAGLPVTHGAKWLATRWIRQAPVDPWTIAAAP